MKRVQQNLLAQRDMELLRKFRIRKQVQINIIKLQLHVPPKQSLIFSLTVSASASKVKVTKGNVLNGATGNAGNNKPFKCLLCTYSTAVSRGLRQHSWTHSPHKRFQCGECSYKTNFKNHLQRHTDAQHSPNPESRERNYPCQLCSKSFFTLSTLHTHLGTHTKEKPFPCHFCSRSFALNNNRNSHEIICIQNPKQSDVSWVESQRQFQCKFCHKKMLSKHKLSRHMRTHTKEKPFQCNVCEYAASEASDLRGHVKRRHNHNPSQTRTSPCNLCSKTFKYSSGLSYHIKKMHTQKTSNDSTCEYCRRPFGANSGRKQHQIICKLNPMQNDTEWVTKQKKFKCKFCEYSSVHSGGMKTHLMRHTGHRPYKCTFCPFRSTTQSSLYVHLGTHRKEKPNKCPHCDFTANLKSGINSHVKLRHRII